MMTLCEEGTAEGSLFLFMILGHIIFCLRIFFQHNASTLQSELACLISMPVLKTNLIIFEDLSRHANSNSQQYIQQGKINVFYMNSYVFLLYKNILYLLYPLIMKFIHMTSNHLSLRKILYG